jgi:hypothetical protein
MYSVCAGGECNVCAVVDEDARTVWTRDSDGSASEFSQIVGG